MYLYAQRIFARNWSAYVAFYFPTHCNGSSFSMRYFADRKKAADLARRFADEQHGSSSLHSTEEGNSD